MIRKKDIKRLGPHSKAVHLGQHEKGNEAFPIPNLVLNSAILLNSVKEGWDMLTNETEENFAYQRYSNPTLKVLEDKFRIIEDAKYTLAINSGMTACYLIFRSLLKTGDHIVSQHSLYHEISDQIIYDLDGCGVDYTFITEYSTESFKTAFKDNTKMVFIETPTNPTLLDVNLKEVADLCRDNNIIFVVDNTLMTPLGQVPLKYGADIVVYSCTKHINGHGDVLGGIITTNNKKFYNNMKVFRDNTGLVMDPFSAWLLIRSLRTFPMRLERHSNNAIKVIKYLRDNYEELEVRTALDGKYTNENNISIVGGIFSFILPSKKAGITFMRSLKMIRVGTTFGNIETLCYHFGGFSRPSRDITKIGIPLGLIRLSIGLEDVDDIIYDVDQALKKVYK